MNILVIGFRNINQNIQSYYKYLTNYNDLNFTLIVPSLFYSDEIIKFKDFTNGKLNFIELETNKKFSIKRLENIHFFKIKDILNAVEEVNPDIIEISDNPESQNIVNIISNLKELYKDKKILLNLWKNPLKNFFNKNVNHINSNIKNADFVILRSELIKNYYTKMNVKTPYKLINFPCDPEMNIPDRDYSKNKVSISIEIEKKFKQYLIFFEYLKHINQNIIFYTRDSISYSILKSKGFECQNIGKVSNTEKNNLLTESDVFIYLKKFDMEEPENSDIIKHAMFLDIPVFLPDVFPYNQIYNKKVFFMQDFSPEDFEKVIFNIDKRKINTKKAYEYMMENFSIKNTSSQIFNIYLYLYKISRITST
ncbi:MAG: hypothetical protein M0R46_15495 [Candidatus Muirbacterium halophilum]|nr:hypothetical protein [Candidatus Muirbacterium halophilum]MCK9477320.1 hypothetical protein [Candidatus Muirbacterium halophilum]